MASAGDHHDESSTPTPPRAPRANSFSRSGGRSWSQEIETTAASLDLRLATIRTRRPPDAVTPEERSAICDGVEKLVTGALRAARGTDPQYRSFRSWWRGTSVEAAFRRSHQAEAELVKLYTDEEVEAETWAAIARVEVALHRDDPIRRAAVRLPGMANGRAKRALLSKVIQVGHEAADGSHTRLRNFRNILLAAAVCIAVLVVAFAVVVASHPSAVPLCFEPQDTVTTVACPTGDGPNQQPASLDVIVVAMLGLLGGALAAAVSIRNLRGTETPYDVPIALALLKVPAGALTAIGGLIAIRGAFVPGLSALDSQEQILAYALVFGYAQQLLTGLIDRQARDLLGSVPSKDSEQSRPPLPMGPAAPERPPGSPAAPAVAVPAATAAVPAAPPEPPAVPALRMHPVPPRTTG